MRPRRLIAFWIRNLLDSRQQVSLVLVAAIRAASLLVRYWVDAEVDETQAGAAMGGRELPPLPSLDLGACPRRRRRMSLFYYYYVATGVS